VDRARRDGFRKFRRPSLHHQIGTKIRLAGYLSGGQQVGASRAVPSVVLSGHQIAFERLEEGACITLRLGAFPEADRDLDIVSEESYPRRPAPTWTDVIHAYT
jgi:hypothetical protein